MTEHVTPLSDSKSQKLQSLFLQMAKDNPTRYAECMLELNYLANILVTAGKVNDRRMRPVEAAEKTLALCNEGTKKLLMLEQQTNQSDSMKVLLKESPVKLFQIGWHIETNG